MSTVPTPTPTPPESWALVDGCPECVTNTEPPFTVHQLETGWSCSYICRDCGHVWSTDWRS